MCVFLMFVAAVMMCASIFILRMEDEQFAPRVLYLRPHRADG